MFAGRVIRTMLRRLGYSIHKNHCGAVSGFALEHDLILHLNSKPQMLVFDVGANTGQSIELFRDTFVEPRIIAFEPSPATYRALKAKFINTPHIIFEEIALGAEPTTATFNVFTEHCTNDSLLTLTGTTAATTIGVEVTTVDAYCAQHSIDLIDLLKIDTQGNDLNVLRGATRMLEQKRIRALTVEVICLEMYDGQPSFVDFLTFLAEYGYQLLGVYEQEYKNNRLWYFNACFVLDPLT